MPVLRPAVKDDDGTLSRIIKYIPTEIVAIYTAIAGVLKPAANTGPLHIDIQRYLYVLIFLVVITPLWTYIAVIDNKDM